MSSKWNSEFFDRYLHSECSADERIAFEEELSRSAELKSSFDEFRRYRELITHSRHYTAPENFTDNVIREIRKKAAPSPAGALLKGLFRREIVGVAVSVLVLAVVFWPHMQSVTTLDESAIVQEVTHQIEQSTADVTVSEREEIETAVLSAKSEAPQISPQQAEEGVQAILSKRSSLQGGGGASVSESAGSSGTLSGETAPVEKGRLAEKKSRVRKAAVPQKEASQVREKQAESGQSVEHSLNGFGMQTATESKALRSEAPVKQKQSPESEKQSFKTESCQAAPQAESQRSFEMEASEMLLSADMEVSSYADQIPEPNHRGVNGLKEEVKLSTDSTPSDKSAFPFDDYDAEVSGEDTLRVTIPHRYLRRLVRDWEKSGGTVIDTVDNDSTVTLLLVE